MVFFHLACFCPCKSQKEGKLYLPPKWTSFCQKTVCIGQWLIFPYSLLIKSKCKNSEGKNVQRNEATQKCLSARQLHCAKPISAGKSSLTTGLCNKINHIISVFLKLWNMHTKFKPFHYHSPLPLILFSVLNLPLIASLLSNRYSEIHIAYLVIAIPQPKPKNIGGVFKFFFLPFSKLFLSHKTSSNPRADHSYIKEFEQVCLKAAWTNKELLVMWKHRRREWKRATTQGHWPDNVEVELAKSN